MTCSLFTDTSTLNKNMLITDMEKENMEWVRVNMVTVKVNKKKEILTNMASNTEAETRNKMISRSKYSLLILGTAARLLLLILLQQRKRQESILKYLKVQYQPSKRHSRNQCICIHIQQGRYISAFTSLIRVSSIITRPISQSTAQWYPRVVRNYSRLRQQKEQFIQIHLTTQQLQARKIKYLIS